MKKYLLLISFLLMSVAIFAQSDFREEVVQTTLSKDIMWNNLKKWVSSTFNDYKRVVDLEDKETGVLIVKLDFSVSSMSDALSLKGQSTIQIDVRENKYRIRISDEYINIGPDYNCTRNASSTKLQEMIGDLELIVNVIKTEKVLVSNLPSIVEEQSDFFSKLPKYKNEKDEKKGRVSSDYVRKERDLAIIKEMLLKYSATSISVIESLKKQMVYVDDF